MSGFISTPPASPTEADAGNTIENDGWFPALKLSEIRAAARIDGSVTPERLRDAALYAMDQVNTRLQAFKLLQLVAARPDLASVPSETIGGASRLVMLYRRAVVCHVSADILEHYRGFDSSGSGEKRASDSDPAIQEQLRNVNWAIRDILGQPHAVVELI